MIRPIVIALLLLLPAVVVAEPRFTDYGDLPEAAQTFVEEVASAVDREKAKELVAKLPAEITLGEVTYTRDTLREAIQREGGIAKAFGLSRGAWAVETHADGGVAIRRGGGTVRFDIAEVSGVWQIIAIVDEDTESTATTLLHPPPARYAGEYTGSAFDDLGDDDEPACSTSTIPSMKMKAGKVTGGVEASVRRYLKRNAMKLSYCYQKELLTSPGLGGEISARFDIDSGGTPTNVLATGVSEEVASCFGSVIGYIDFPKPPEGEAVTVSYTFNFVDKPPAFDADSCKQLPRALRKTAAAVVVAVHADDARPVVKALATKLVVRGAKTTAKLVKKELAKAGLLGWLGLGRSNSWTLTEAGRGRFHLSVRLPSTENDLPTLVVAFKKTKGAYRIVEISEKSVWSSY